MLERIFRLRERNTTPATEITAGITTFLTAAYIIFVHPNVLAQAGMDKGALTTVTCLAAAGGTLLIALWARAPLMMAPGMGLNAFFTYTLVLGRGLPWQTALGVVFISGLLFLVLTWAGIRERLAHAIPISLRLASSVGIGLFIAFIGLKNLGLIIASPAVLVQLGPFTPQVVLGLLGLLLAVLLELRKIRGALLIAIITTTTLGILCGQSPTPNGIVALPPSPAPLIMALDIMAALDIAVWSSILAFMFVDLFDSLGTMLAVCREAKMTDENGEIPGLSRMLSADALATVAGALLGTSTTTTYIESASGVAEGGRTGLTGVVTALLFLGAAFFTPLIGAVPAYATAPALIIVGVFMMRGIDGIDFYDFQEGVPAFLTIILMPLTFSIANGLAFGFAAYTLILICRGKLKECDPFLLAAAIFSVLNFCF